MIGRRDADFSLSGLKTAVRLEAEKIAPLSDRDVADLCASFQLAVVEMVADRLRQGLQMFRQRFGAPTALVAAGGVAANQAIREALLDVALQHQVPLVVPPPALCTDNAAMIAWAGRRAARLRPARFARRRAARALAARRGNKTGRPATRVTSAATPASHVAARRPAAMPPTIASAPLATAEPSAAAETGDVSAASHDEAASHEETEMPESAIAGELDTLLEGAVMAALEGSDAPKILDTSDMPDTPGAGGEPSMTAAVEPIPAESSGASPSDAAASDVSLVDVGAHPETASPDAAPADGASSQDTEHSQAPCPKTEDPGEDPGEERADTGRPEADDAGVDEPEAESPVPQPPTPA